MKNIKNKGDHEAIQHSGEDKYIDQKIPGGWIYMERELPFILVYRFDPEEKDKVIVNILKNEASYMFFEANQTEKNKIIFKKIIKAMSDRFGAFLALEIWPGNAVDFHNRENDAHFVLYGPAEKIPSTIEHLQESLEKSYIGGLRISVDIKSNGTRKPRRFTSLLKIQELKQLECLLIGIQVERFYLNFLNNLTYPIVERELYSKFSEILKKSIFDFVKVQTNHNISNFQVLARRNLSDVIWEIDHQLVEIDSKLDLILLVSPVNLSTAWKEFRSNKFRKPPIFHYRMLPADPDLLKRKLYNIPIEDIDDPTMGYLFRDKRIEMDKMLSMLLDRDTEEFRLGSIRLYGDIPEKTLIQANEILKLFPKNIEKEKKMTGRDEFISMAKRELRYLKDQYPGVETEIEISDSVSGLLVNKGKLIINKNFRIERSRAEGIVQHEIGTHVLTYYNGAHQPLQLLKSGVPGYESLQEGLAVLAEYLTGGLSADRLRLLAARVIAVHDVEEKGNFISTFRILTEKYNFSPYQAFTISARVYRGGGLTKDAVYLKGFIELLDYLKLNNYPEKLLIGKIRQDYLPVIDELIERRILHPVRIKPRYLKDPRSDKKISELRKLRKVTDLIK
jgi:uncharacterized protein (TIGR02421 family)